MPKLSPNAQLVSDIFGEVAKGNGAPFWDRFARGADRRQHVPLPQDARCYAVAASIGQQTGDLKNRLLGDGLVPLDSALGRHRDPARCLQFAEDRQWIGYGVGHLDLLKHPEVYAQLLRWLAPGNPA